MTQREREREKKNAVRAINKKKWEHREHTLFFLSKALYYAIFVFDFCSRSLGTLREHCGNIFPAYWRNYAMFPLFPLTAKHFSASALYQFVGTHELGVEDS